MSLTFGGVQGTPKVNFSKLSVSRRPGQRNFVQLGSKPVLQKSAISRLGTKSEKVMRF
jgi:hypothetical protein